MSSVCSHLHPSLLPCRAAGHSPPPSEQIGMLLAFSPRHTFLLSSQTSLPCLSPQAFDIIYVQASSRVQLTWPVSISCSLCNADFPFQSCSTAAPKQLQAELVAQAVSEPQTHPVTNMCFQSQLAKLSNHWNEISAQFQLIHISYSKNKIREHFCSHSG